MGKAVLRTVQYHRIHFISSRRRGRFKERLRDILNVSYRRTQYILLRIVHYSYSYEESSFSVSKGKGEI
jgi:hypothetical protein